MEWGKEEAYFASSVLAASTPLPRVIVAIDGPAGSGKSTTARRVADVLGWLYLDTGAMYRTVALAFRERGVAFTDEAAAGLLASLDLDLQVGADGLVALLDGEDVTERIRTPEVTEAASRVSALPAVRRRLVAEQRRMAREQAADGRGVVIVGRDLGTGVFPDAEVKIYQVANPAARAERRHREMASRGETVTLDAVAEDIAERDARDAGRAVSPLRQAADAVELDTTGLGIDEQVARVVALVRERRDAPTAAHPLPDLSS